ncbi:hypothetical protein [Tenacibaculum sp. MAR_2009_124]|uniref:hypothetical protein n=1 Tax=Tenacibaculum sp. MAR_2009_124 TaxID=1250059 RepID=UPI000B80322B|nr:hypothetical protein [Tenacibaculum sp. MAR_2009_124]
MKKIALLVLLLFTIHTTCSQVQVVKRGVEGLVKLFRIAKPKPRFGPILRTQKLPTTFKGNKYKLYTDDFYKPWIEKRKNLYTRNQELYKRYQFNVEDYVKQRELKEAFGTKNVSLKEESLFFENKKALLLVEDEFGYNMGWGKYVNNKVYDAICAFQKKNNIKPHDFAVGFGDKYKVTQEGVERFIAAYEELKTRLFVGQKLARKFKVPTELPTLRQHLYYKWRELKRFRLAPKDLDFIAKAKPFNKAVDNLDFDKINALVDENLDLIIKETNELERKLYTLGYIESPNTEILIKNQKDFFEELDFLHKRLEKAKNQFKKDHSLNEEIAHQDFKTRAQEELNRKKEEFQIVLDTDKNDLESLMSDYLKIHKNLDNGEFALSSDIRKKLKEDITNQNYYVKTNAEYQKFHRNKIPIKVALNKVEEKDAIQLFDGANVYMERTSTLGDDISKLKKDLSTAIDKRNMKTVFLSKHESNLKLTKDKVIDSLRKMFPKGAINFIKNKSTNYVKRKIKNEFKKNKGGKLFLVGHVENGSFKGVGNSNYIVDFEYVKKLGKEYNVDVFTGGCSSSYYNVAAGTTDIINDLNFGLAIANSFKKANTYKDLITSISNEKINGGIGKVKIILKPDSFSNVGDTKVEVFYKKNGVWRKLVDFIFNYFKI